MRRTVLLSLLLLIALPASAADDARARVRAAAEAMGGEARLRALSSLRVQGIGHWNLFEQFERPAAPWLVIYEQLDELLVPARHRLRQKTESRGAGAPGDRAPGGR